MFGFREVFSMITRTISLDIFNVTTPLNLEINSSTLELLPFINLVCNIGLYFRVFIFFIAIGLILYNVIGFINGKPVFGPQRPAGNGWPELPDYIIEKPKKKGQPAKIIEREPIVVKPKSENINTKPNTNNNPNPNPNTKTKPNTKNSDK